MVTPVMPAPKPDTVVQPATIAKQLGRENTEVVIDAAPGAVVQKLASQSAEGGSNIARNRMNGALCGCILASYLCHGPAPYCRGDLVNNLHIDNGLPSAAHSQGLQGNQCR